MYRNPNQREVLIQKPNYKNEDEIFFYGGAKEARKAMKNLSNGGKALYIYFLTNANNYKEIIIPSVIEQEIGLTRSGYYRAFEELVDQGYLHRESGKKSNYIFSPAPIFPIDEECKPPQETTTISNSFTASNFYGF